MRGMTGAVREYFVLDDIHGARVSCALSSLACFGRRDLA